MLPLSDKLYTETLIVTLVLIYTGSLDANTWDYVLHLSDMQHKKKWKRLKHLVVLLNFKTKNQNSTS